MQWADELSQLADDQLEEVVRHDLGPLNFEPAMPNLRRIRDWSLAVGVRDSEDLSGATASNIGQRLTNVAEIVRQIRDFDITAAGNPNDLRNNLLSQVQQQKDWFADEVAPLGRLSEVDVTALAVQAQTEAMRIRELTAESEQLVERMRVVAGTAAATQVSMFYSGQAIVHRHAATRFFWLGWVFLVATVGAAVGAFVLLPPSSEKTTEWLLFLREIIARLLIVGIPAYVVAFAFRNYRVNKHLQTVNEQKRTALDTYPLFTESITDDQTRALIALEIVRATVGVSDTGYLAPSNEKTILETPPLAQFIQRPPAS